ncbi:HAMP domain-containing sensor histidine kinase [uncultured Adlercreutzia sp.]|uniref:HAMP domain-containing sensor histidine kinase n=1 Tax=uncultured Adlercreutzia sp. TaxID=875803 RepID=UPI0025FBA4C9|nr:HAMP domain-containing sensor histidine kinase [uncultured Adlercreutzia sp.]
MPNPPLRLTARITARLLLVIGGIFLGTGAITGLTAACGVQPTHQTIFLALLASCIIAGACVAVVVNRSGIAVVENVSNAARQVARGNFDVSLPATPGAGELDEMAENFSLMVRELAGMTALRSNFVANVSHEFKTPLAAIEGFAALLQEETLDEAQRQRCLDGILRNTRQLSRLSGNLLQLSRLESQQIWPAFTPIDLAESLREAIIDQEPRWSGKELELDLDLEEGIATAGDKDLLALAWKNIIDNAIKFTPVGGSLTIAAWTEGGDAVVTITDTGDGMDEETRRRAFEQFYQGDTSHRSEGNGLGLALVGRIVDIHRGRIALTSQPGQGARVEVRLPRIENGVSRR